MVPQGNIIRQEESSSVRVIPAHTKLSFELPLVRRSSGPIFPCPAMARPVVSRKRYRAASRLCYDVTRLRSDRAFSNRCAKWVRSCCAVRDQQRHLRDTEMNVSAVQCSVVRRVEPAVPSFGRQPWCPAPSSLRRGGGGGGGGGWGGAVTSQTDLFVPAALVPGAAPTELNLATPE